jgi:hypothetical protein
MDFANDRFRENPLRLHGVQVAAFCRSFVNTASRMESHGVPGAIHCTEATGMLLQGTFRLQVRGAMVIKGKGEVNTFLLLNLEAIPNG